MNRQMIQVIPGITTSDGAGVRLRRSLGGHDRQRLDPFLMLDEFSSNDPMIMLRDFRLIRTVVLKP